MEGALAQESAGLTCLLRDHIASATAALRRLRAAMHRHDEAVMREPPPPLSPQVHGNFVVAASRPTKQALERFGLPEQTGSTPVVWLHFVEFGADPTGLHDSSEALSAAIAAAHGYGAHCTLFIPAGEYRLDLPPAGSSAQPTPPVMHPLTLRGVGSNRTLLRFCSARRRDSFPVWLGCSDSRLSGIKVLYGGEPDDAPAPGCAEVQRVDVLADDLVVSEFEPHRWDPTRVGHHVRRLRLHRLQHGRAVRRGREARARLRARGGRAACGRWLRRGAHRSVPRCRGAAQLRQRWPRRAAAGPLSITPVR